MRYFILLVTLSITSIASGQTNDWAPVGAKWVYNYTFCMSGPDCGLVFFESIGDTTILGKDCRAISRKEVLLDKDDIAAVGTFFESDSIIYMYEDSGKVHVYDKFNEEFFVLYDFNMKPGDTLVISDTNTYRGFRGFGCHSSNLDPPYDSVWCHPIAYMIESDTVITLNGKDHYVQRPYYGFNYQGIESGLILLGSIIEGIGATVPNMFGTWPDYRAIGYRHGRLLCYSVSGQPVYEDYEGACQEVTGTGNSIVSRRNNNIEIYPNPTDSKLTISNKGGAGISKAIFFDLMGRPILQQELSCSDRKLIDLSELPQGQYLVQFQYCSQSTVNKSPFYIIIKLRP